MVHTDIGSRTRFARELVVTIALCVCTTEGTSSFSTLFGSVLDLVVTVVVVSVTITEPPEYDVVFSVAV